MSFWDNIACFYDAAQWFNRKVYRTILTGVRTLVPLGAEVLDCASGTGKLTLAAAEKASHVMCTDLSLAMLEQAREMCFILSMTLKRRFRNYTELPERADGLFFQHF